MWRYLDLLRKGSVTSAVAVTDATSINSLLTFIDMGREAAAENPTEYLRRTIESKFLEPGSESFIVLEDVHNTLQPRLQYAGLPLWEMMG